MLNTVFRSLHSLPLKLSLALPFAFLLMGATGLTWYLAHENNKQITQDLIGQQRREVIARIDGTLREYLREPMQLNQQAASLLRQGLLDSRDTQGWGRFFHDQVRNSHRISSMAIGTPSREHVGINRIGDNTFQRVADASTAYDRVSHILMANGQLGAVSSVDKDFDVRTRPWYTAAVKAGRPAWAKIFPHFNAPTLVMGAVEPVHEASGELKAVLFTWLELASINDFLASLKYGLSGQAFIMDTEGLLIGSSKGESPLRADRSRLKASQSQNPITRQSALLLASLPGQSLKKETLSEFHLGGEKYFLQASPFHDAAGLDWIIAVVIPERDFMAAIDKTNRETALLGLVLLVCFFLSGWLVLRHVARPIAQINGAARKLARHEWDTPLPVERGDELGDLARSFQSMASELHDTVDELDKKVAKRTAALNQSKEEAERALEELKRTQASLIESEKMASLGSLVAGVAHEVNTPVGIAYTTSSHLADETRRIEARMRDDALRKSDLQQYLDLVAECSTLILNSTGRAAELISSFKEIAVDQSSEQLREFELRHYLEEILLSLRPTLKKTRVEVELDCPDTLHACTYPGALSQVLTNLVLNALIHAFPENAAGHIWIRVEPELNDQIRLTFRDDGRGIPEENLGRIFEPFFTTNRGAGGSGLGLHIVYNFVVSSLKGQIHVASTLGEGTTFVIHLPRVLRPAESDSGGPQ